MMKVIFSLCKRRFKTVMPELMELHHRNIEIFWDSMLQGLSYKAKHRGNQSFIYLDTPLESI